MSTDNNRQRVVITGAGTGIGRSTALRFSASGAKLLLLGRRMEPLQELAAEIDADNPDIAAVDCADSKTVSAVINEFAGAHGGIDVLVANAGINPQRADALEADDEHWQETMRINLDGVHHTCRAVLPHMLSKEEGGERGAIVTLGSIAGLAGMKDRAAYGPSKAAVINYTQSLAIDFGPRGIRANCVCPGFVVTDINREWLDTLPEEQRNKLEERHLLGLGAPEQVAEAIFFLSSPAASWITGVALAVDGGWRAS
jgi:NAD(P)-dependent dehydrogenase (short-subunit alcohol dehydrogenase family)